MDKIIYQGQEIEAELIGQVDRRIDCGSHYNASDSLLRDNAGFYYVQREILEAVQHPTTEALRSRGYALADGARVELYDAKGTLKQSMAVTSEEGWVKYR